MNDPPRIRPATAEDAAAIAELGARTFHEAFADGNSSADLTAYIEQAFTTAHIRAEIEDRANTFLLAFAGPGPAPTGYAKLRAGEADPCVRGTAPVELERIYVERKAMGNGAGGGLMRACLDQAAAAGYRTLWLGVWECNRRAMAFYHKWGFETAGEHVFQLGSDAQTDLVLVRAVEPP